MEIRYGACPTNWLRDAHARVTGDEPFPRRQTADGVDERIERARDALKPLYPDQLAPGPVTNEAFGELVDIALGVYSSKVEVNDPELRAICNAGEGQMEAFYARQALEYLESEPGALESIRERAAQKNPAGEREWKIELLRALYSPPGKPAYPYLDNYVKMVEQAEGPMVEALGPSSLTFAGSGPMDLTADLMLVHHPELHLNELDRDASAVELSRRLSAYKEELGIIPAGSKTILQRDLGEGLKGIPTDVLFIAAAIPGPVRSAVLQGLKDVDAVIMRDSRGLAGGLLYEPLEVEGMEVLYQAHPVQHFLNGDVSIEGDPKNIWPVSGEIVNSTIALKPPTS